MPTFNPPTENIPLAPPLERWNTLRGRAVWRTAGTWSESSSVYFPDMQAADLLAGCGGEKIDGQNDSLVFFGGHVYTISSACATLLTAAGYGAYIT